MANLSGIDEKFQVQNLIALKALHQEGFTILDNLVDC